MAGLGYDVFADVNIDFTVNNTSVGSGGTAGPWSVLANDPILVYGFIPEPATAAVFLLAGVFGLRRRRR